MKTVRIELDYSDALVILEAMNVAANYAVRQANKASSLGFYELRSACYDVSTRLDEVYKNIESQIEE